MISMAFLRDLPIARKFTLAFGLVCTLCISLGGYTVSTFREVATRNTDVSENSFPAVVHLSDIRESINVARRQDLDLLLCQTPACVTEHIEKRQEALNSYRAALHLYEPEITYPGERELFQKFTRLFESYEEISNQGLIAVQGGNWTRRLLN